MPKTEILTFDRNPLEYWKFIHNFEVNIVGPLRVKGRKSLWNGMWHGVRNSIIMRNTIYAGNKLTEERILFSRQFYKSSSFFNVADY